MGAVVGCTIILIIIAYVVYVKNNTVPAAEGSTSGLHKLVYNKYYVDELYNAIIVKPLYWISGKVEVFIEKSGIDRIVNGFGDVVVGGSKVTRLLQNGNIGFYIFIMVISIIVLLAAKGFMY